MIATRPGRAARLSALTLLLVLGAREAPAADPPPGMTPKRAVAPVAPDLPPGTVAALHEGRYDLALERLERATVSAKDPAVRSYFALIRGTALRLARRPDEAREVWSGALAADPGGPWAAKIRFALAGAELAAGRAGPAETLARADAEALLDGDRKDRLAGVYFAFARRLLKPDDPVTPPDPAGAYALLSQARGLAKGAALRGVLRLEMARAAASSNNHPQAIADYDAYLTGPKPVERFAALFEKGRSQALLHQYPEARLTWTDLAAELARPENAGRPEAPRLRARALYEIALTYGVPNPSDGTQLNLGVAALRRYLDAYPADDRAVAASYEIGASYLARGESDRALAAFRRFLKGDDYRATTDAARRDLATLAMRATFQVGSVLQGQTKYADAIGAWQGYLAKYPDGPESADAQRAILDTRLLIAADASRRGEYAEARAVWSAFVAANPLDPRVPQILFEIGESHANASTPDEAVAAWQTLLSRFPNTEPAWHAQFLIAGITADHRGDPASAIDRYRKVGGEPWASQARARVAVMERVELTVVTPRAFRSGETPHLKVSTRNLESLRFTAYRLDAEAYFRKKQALDDVEALDIGLVAADAEWTVPVAGYAKYREIEAAYDLKVAVPGVWVVKVSDETHLQATTLVLGSDVDAIVKSSRDQLLVFAQDMKTGKGRPGARVLVSDGSGVILDKTTGADGVLLADWAKPRDPGAALHYLVLDGAHAAGTDLGLPDKVAQGLAPRAYLYTDRPAYRPGQSVALRGIVREVKDGRYDDPSGASYKLEVIDSRGRLLVGRPVALSTFGTFGETLRLDPAAPVGTYRVRLYRPGRSDFAGTFEVQAYQLEKADLAFDLPRTVYYRGETVSGAVVAKYPYGTPIAGRPVQVTLPDGRTLRGTTDPAGKYPFTFPTSGFAEEQTLNLVAALPAENVAATASVSLAIRAFSIAATTARDVYLQGESFALKVRTIDALGAPTGQALTVTPIRRVTTRGVVSEVEGKARTLTTDPKTGEASVDLTIDEPDGGSFTIRVAGTDRFGNAVVTDRPLTISGAADETKLRILADRTAFKVGETASVDLHSRSDAPTTALVAWEADRLIQYRLVALKPGHNPLTWAVDGGQFPNFTLTAARMDADRFDEARLDLRVERDLRLTLRPKAPTAAPGAPVEVEVTAADQSGRPVAAELSIAVVDMALLRLHGDTLPPIGPYFYNQTRTGAFATTSTNTFTYTPTTTSVAEAIVEEAARAEALRADLAKSAEVRREAGAMAANAPQAPAMATPMAPAVEEPAADAKAVADVNRPFGMMGGGMGGMGGRMGGMGGNGMGMAPGADDGKDKDRPAASKPAMLSDNLQEGKSGRVRANYRVEAVRERFVETAYWNPSVVTGADGKATVRFNAPTALSSYRLTARGVTGADTLVGQTTADLVVKKAVFVDLKTPAGLAEGDRPRFVGTLHHAGVVGEATLKLAVYAGGRTTVYPRTLAIKGDGVDEVVFDPIDVPDGDPVRLTLRVEVGGASDEVTAEVPVRPRGVQAYASASGTSSDGATAIVGLPPGRPYENPEMLITLAPTVRRLVVELAMGESEYGPIGRGRSVADLAPCPVLPTIADRAADLMAASAALTYLRWTKAETAPEAGRLSSRIAGLVAELITLQNDDGGWPWVARTGEGRALPSDRSTSALAAQAFAAAWSQAMMTDPAAFDRAANYLAQTQGRIDAADLELKATFVHALASMNRGSFEAANALNRVRNGLPDAALAELSLALASLDRAALAGEVLDLLATRAKAEPVGPGERPRTYWEGANQDWHRGRVETTALVAEAFARSRPAAPELARAVDYLLAHRSGGTWQPATARGAALAALAKAYGDAAAAADRYRLVVTVNDAEVLRADVDGDSPTRAVLVPRKAIKVGDANTVRFSIEGRGTFGYSVSLTGFSRAIGPEQARAGKPFYVARREFLPADPELDGKPLPTGFSKAVNPDRFTNTATQVALGGRARVRIETAVDAGPGRRPWEKDFLVIEEALPAGTTLIDGSLASPAASHTLADGVLTLYFPPGVHPGTTTFDVFGTLPGEYLAAPTTIRSAYDPGRLQLGPAGALRVLEPGKTSDDPYRPTPDELYARGKALFDAGRVAEAAAPLEALSAGYTLHDSVVGDVARMLLTAHIADRQPRKIVADFEILKEKAPERIIAFDDVAAVARAYRDIGEHERAYLVWRAIVEASYLEDAQVGEVLRQKGKTLDALAYLLDLWRDYPDTASIEADLFGLAQLYALSASKAVTDPTLRAELASAGVSRSELLLQSIRLGQVLLAIGPKNPLADEIGLAEIGAYLDLDDFEAVVRLASRFARVSTRREFLDSFQYSEALGRFNLGQYDRAIDVAEAISKATFKDASGVEQPSPNKWQALYILGQIHDARREPAKAVAYYTQVADRFSDAAGAVHALTRKSLTLPEVSLVRPGAKPDDGGTARARGARVSDRPVVALDYRNIAEADVTVYPVDLMRLYLTRRNLEAIAGIDLAGITPLYQSKVKLGDGLDFDDKVRSIDLPLTKEGAYLVMIRGENLYASGIVLVSPLELDVLEDPAAGRVRVVVRDARTKGPAPKVNVKVIGSGNHAFLSGQTDLRGVFVAEGVIGQVTAVARREPSQYAFYRGTAPPEAAVPPNPPAPAFNKDADLGENVKRFNAGNQLRGVERLENRYKAGRKGIQAQEAN